MLQLKLQKILKLLNKRFKDLQGKKEFKVHIKQKNLFSNKLIVKKIILQKNKNLLY